MHNGIALHDPWAGPDALVGRTVLLAMSGGVDSSAAAVLLQQRGARVLGVTMKNFCWSDVDDAGDISCCSVRHTLDAQRVCERLGIPHHLLDSSRPFQSRVIDRFVHEYEAGRTPNPCVDCNSTVRFPLLLEKADELGAELVATGHYARVGRADDGHTYLQRGRDAAKDQSYFLQGVPEACLERTLFPLGTLQKHEVRRVARQAGLDIAEKAESQEICFLPDGGRDAFLEQHGNPVPGDIRDLDGNLLGAHRGIGNYTVGQRRGLQVAVGEPVYVHHIDAATQTVVVGDATSLRCQGVTLENAWHRGTLPAQQATVQIRYRGEPVPIASSALDAGTMHLRFAAPVRAVAPGQTAVLYDGDVVIGGGRIQSTHAD